MKYHISEVTISADNASPLRLSLAIEKDYLILSQDAMEVEINPDELDIIAAQGKMLLMQFQETQPVSGENDGAAPADVAMSEASRSSENVQDYLDRIKVYGSTSPAPPAPAGGLVERVAHLLAKRFSESRPGTDCTPFACDVLREVADQLKAPVDLGLYGNSYWAGMSAAETKLRAIAAELEGANPDCGEEVSLHERFMEARHD